MSFNEKNDTGEEKATMKCDCEEFDATCKVLIVGADGKVIDTIEACGRCIGELFRPGELAETVIRELQG